MKKKSKAVISSLAAAAVGGGIAVGAIAQECNATRAPGRDSDLDKTNIATALNSLNNYNGSTATLNPLAMAFLEVINSDINEQSLTVFTITTLSVIRVVAADTEFNGGRYTTTPVEITGTATTTSSPGTFRISGSSTFIVDVVENELSPTIVNGLIAQSSLSRVVEAMGELSSYNGDSTNLTVLATRALTFITDNVSATTSETLVIQEISFTAIETFQVAVSNNQYTISNLQMQVIAVNSSDERYFLGGVSTLVFGVAQDMLQLQSITNLGNLTTTASTISSAFNELSSYTSATTDLSMLAQQTLTLLNTTILAILSHAANSVVINSINFAPINFSNIRLENNTFTVNNVSISGMTTPDTSSALSFFGSGIITFTVSNNIINVTSIENLGFVEPETLNFIVSGVNFFENWNSATPVPDGISTNFLAAISNFFTSNFSEITAVSFSPTISLETLGYDVTTNEVIINAFGTMSSSVTGTLRSTGSSETLTGSFATASISPTTGLFSSFSFVL